jgi:hypothetical protein
MTYFDILQGRNRNMVYFRLVRFVGALVGISFLMSSGLFAAEADLDTSKQQAIEKELKQLQEMRNELLDKSNDFDQRIRNLESQLGVDDKTSPSRSSNRQSTDNQWGRYEPGKGFVFARTSDGEVDFSVFTYVRYLNQKNLEKTYTDAFGRTSDLDIRNDIQFQKLTLNFKGWLFDPKFRYLFYTWTSNTSQGDPAQVVVAGNLGYNFDEVFSVYAGIGALPSTRSTNYTFPNWLKNDHRTISDEYFRGSYTTGIWASGEIADGLKYRAMLGNNLSQLGVNAAQLDEGLNTVSAALWWMPTTGEYGPGEGFGDYEDHQQVATLFGIHFTNSREDAQGQPGTDSFENSQIRLSDGTRIFSNDPFGTGGNIQKATYQMLAINGGFKYNGWSLEAELYRRWVDDFELSSGSIPVTELNDTGYQLQGSTMIIPKNLQAYLGYSKVIGEYGNPYDVSVGLNWYYFDRKETRISVQGLYLKDSPVGYSSVPFAVGGNGWVFTADWIVAF